MSFECVLFFHSSNAATDPVPVDGSLVGNARCPYDLVLAAAMLRIFGSNDERSGLTGVYTFNSSDRYFGYAVVSAVWHRESWRHRKSKHWHQLDLVLTQCTNLGNVKLTRNYQSADCDTDHSLVCCKVNFKAKRVHHAKKEGRHRINTCMTRKPDKVHHSA